MKKIQIISIMLLICFFQAHAQMDSLQNVKSKYCVPAIKGIPIGKGFSFEYQTLPNVAIETKDKTGIFSDSKSTIKSNSNIEAKLKIPIFDKPYLTVLGGLKYTFEEYHFENPVINPLYKNLEDRGLKSIGANVTVIKPTKSNKFWIFKASADLNGDYDQNNGNLTDYLKFSISPALGWKVNDNFSYALGLSYNYRFGSPLILPVIAFNKNLNEKWSIEAILPLFIKSRFKFDEGISWLNTIEVEGASYKLNNFSSEFPQFDNLHLHRSDIQFTTRIEKKLVGWLWAATEVGFRKNLTYDLTNSNKANNNIIFDNTIKSALLFNVSLFISPRKKL
ncbi:DUF6268 family outer membrane beta-barrel protein [Flavobacterium soyangense]|uniref:DUF6268 domain-containing protein n=1 Tax=Flavobacterium soyangense TaxID=2023265 RepID=A0A930UA19_9FLAO|nr:DUF6268 family outer membrane beta-barrel protein [Flavobacterium soyangense]MBF2709446.1 hypothetical protein [Flavobacterium soyangense]